MTNNQSPYDSGHDSSYSHASGPGHPPSSRRNSDIDDQVDRYIREQRVATLISDTPSATTTTLPQSHDTQQGDRNIAISHRLLAALPHLITHDPVPLNTASFVVGEGVVTCSLTTLSSIEEMKPSPSAEEEEYLLDSSGDVVIIIASLLRLFHR
jgi:hypothetical protein